MPTWPLNLKLLKAILEKSSEALQKREVIESVEKERPKDIGKACRLLWKSGSSRRYRSTKDDNYLIESLQKLAVNHPREGFWKFHYRIRNSGGIVNNKFLNRVLEQMGSALSTLSLESRHRMYISNDSMGHLGKCSIKLISN